MRKSILMIIFSLLMYPSFAQKKVHEIFLTPKKIGIEPTFSVSEVLDRRLIKSNVGFVQKGLANRRVAAILPDSFPQYMKYVFKRMLPNCPDCPSLVAIIHEFNVSEHTKAISELGTFRIQFEFARRNGESLYSVGYIEAQIEGKGMDVTLKHSNRILEGVTYCLEEFSQTKWEALEGQKIKTDFEYVFDYNKIPKAGLYSSFAKMSQGEAFRTEGYVVTHHGVKYPKYYVKNANGKRLGNRVMGFSDGEHIYINASRYSYESHFVQCKAMGKYLYFEDRFADPMSGIMFGLLGSALSNIAKAILLDTSTGLIVTLDERGMDKFLTNYPAERTRYLSSKKRIIDKAEVIRIINAKIN